MIDRKVIIQLANKNNLSPINSTTIVVCINSFIWTINSGNPVNLIYAYTTERNNIVLTTSNTFGGTEATLYFDAITNQLK